MGWGSIWEFVQRFFEDFQNETRDGDLWMDAHVWIWDSLRGVLETFALRPHATDPPAKFYNTLAFTFFLN